MDVDVYGCIWMYMDVYGCVWMWMDVDGCGWMRMDVDGPPKVWPGYAPIWGLCADLLKNAKNCPESSKQRQNNVFGRILKFSIDLR